MARRANDAAIETRETVVGTIRQNAIPAALAAIGLVWLFMNRGHSSTSVRAQGRRSHGARGDWEGNTGAYGGDEDYGRYPQGGYRHEENGGAAQRARQMAGQAVDRVQETVGGLAHQASDAAGSVVEGARHQAEQAAAQARRLEGKLEETYHTNPLALGAAILAAGAVVALSLPRTRREDALMGETRDRLLHDAEGAAQGAVDGAHRLAENAAEKAKGLPLPSRAGA